MSKTVTVQKANPYLFDLGLLCAYDSNRLEIDPSNREESLKCVARDGAQALVNQMLSTLKIDASKDGVLLELPPVTTRLPREKPIPTPKAETKWQAFAKRRGIAPKTREQRRNLQYNATTGGWERKWGYQGANKAGEDDGIIELDDKTEAGRKEGTSVRGDKRREIRLHVKRNDRRMRKNQRGATSS